MLWSKLITRGCLKSNRQLQDASNDKTTSFLEELSEGPGPNKVDETGPSTTNADDGSVSGNAPPITISSQIDNLGDDVLRWLGKDSKVINTPAGDTIVQSADGLREIRFDFNRTYPHKSPHMHLVEYQVVKNKKVEITNRRIYPSGVTPE